jgi:peptidoglycan/LPS O-acetylase OafA/YrhL
MLINVQFLRFAAAMLVVVYHVSAHIRDAGIDPGPFFQLSEAVGFAGVDIFFVISGFIMAYTTHAAAGAVDAWAFARRRMARIYSGYWPFFLLALHVFYKTGSY